jgi:hypothetical protein
LHLKTLTGQESAPPDNGDVNSDLQTGLDSKAMVVQGQCSIDCLDSNSSFSIPRCASLSLKQPSAFRAGGLRIQFLDLSVEF